MISPPMSAGGRLRAGREPLSHSGHHRPATAWRPIALVQGPRTPRIRPNVVRDAYVTMPNHVHAILVIETVVSRTGASPASRQSTGVRRRNGCRSSGWYSSIETLSGRKGRRPMHLAATQCLDGQSRLALGRALGQMSLVTTVETLIGPW